MYEHRQRPFGLLMAGRAPCDLFSKNGIFCPSELMKPLSGRVLSAEMDKCLTETPSEGQKSHRTGVTATTGRR